jgi:hypothetical protein
VADVALDDAQLASHQARLVDEALGAHLVACERCLLARRMRVEAMFCPRAAVLTRRWFKAMTSAMFYAGGRR